MYAGADPTAKFVHLHFVDERYHEQHSQLLHKHDDLLELFYVMKGEGQYIVAGKKYFVRSGNLVICNAGTMHGEEPFHRHNMESYCCVLQGIALHGMEPNTLGKPEQNPILYFSEDRDAVEHILLALYALDQSSAAYDAALNQLANGLLSIVYEKLHRRQQPNVVTEKNTEEFIQNIMQYLDTHFIEPLQLHELGVRFHISPFYLAHIFKAETGISMMKYIMCRKIGESQNLLMNTQLPIGAISERLGFSDHCHFSTTFKKYIGITPTQYRQHFQKTLDWSDTLKPYTQVI